MNFEQVARTIAPTVAAGLLGPLDGVVTNMVAGFLLPNVDRSKITAQDVITKIGTLSDPAEFAKLKEAELAVRQFEADNGFRFAQLESESQQNARAMRTTALASGNKITDALAWWTLASFLVVAALVLIVVVLALLRVLNIQDNASVWAAASGLLGSVLGYFSANANQVISFYFGSSSGSAAKTDQLAQNTSDVIAELGRTARGQAAAPLPAPAGGPVIKVQQADDGTTTTTVATTEPETGHLASNAAAAPATVVPPPNASPPASAVPNGTPTPVVPGTDEPRFQTCMKIVFDHEGGFSNRVADMGGPTNMGITMEDLHLHRHAPVTIDDVRTMTRAEAAEIYRQDYWQVSRAGDLPAGVDLCVFDTAVLFGPGLSDHWLQMSLGFTGKSLDGKVGPDTIHAADAATPTAIIEGMTDLREQHHRAVVAKRPDQQVNLQGWLNRNNQLRQEALAMAAAAAAV